MGDAFFRACARAVREIRAHSGIRTWEGIVFVMGRYGIRLRLSSVPDTIPSHVRLQSQAPDASRTARAQARKKADCGGARGEGVRELGQLKKWWKMVRDGESGGKCKAL